MIIPLALLLFTGFVLDDCFEKNNEDAVADNKLKKTHSFKTGGTCKSDYDVYKSETAFMNGICNGKGYEIIEMRPEIFRCDSGWYNLEYKIKCK